jgi:hypothetical protein
MHVFQYHELWLRGRAEGYHARGFKFKTNSGLQFFLSIMPLNANFKENLTCGVIGHKLYYRLKFRLKKDGCPGGELHVFNEITCRF